MATDTTTDDWTTIPEDGRLPEDQAELLREVDDRRRVRTADARQLAAEKEPGRPHEQ